MPGRSRAAPTAQRSPASPRAASCLLGAGLARRQRALSPPGPPVRTSRPGRRQVPLSRSSRAPAAAKRYNSGTQRRLCRERRKPSGGSHRSRKQRSLRTTKNTQYIRLFTDPAVSQPLRIKYNIHIHRPETQHNKIVNLNLSTQTRTPTIEVTQIRADISPPNQTPWNTHVTHQHLSQNIQ